MRKAAKGMGLSGVLSERKQLCAQVGRAYMVAQKSKVQ